MEGSGRGYQLRCCGCGARYDDDGVRLDCDLAHPPALLRTVYQGKRFDPVPEPSMGRFRHWLPVRGELTTSARTAVYQSTGIARHLGLRDLWIAFNGWWPQRDATLVTATFKELEAVTVFARLEPGEPRTLVVASAGNTAAAFAAVATERDAPVVIVIPLDAWAPLSALVRLGPTVRVIAIQDGTYEDAIALGKRLSACDGYVAEGGVRNIGRRDGMGTILLSAVDAIDALPDAYVQAVGSAAGALAAHEAALRVIADGRFGARLPRLVLGQNAPFTPIHDAWGRFAPVLDEITPAQARERQAQIGAAVLGNPAPPYATSGGIREALAASSGRTYAVDNAEMFEAMMLFGELEGVDIEPAAGIAVATLVRAARDGAVGRDDSVLLNVTGGGRSLRPVVGTEQRPAVVVDRARLASLSDIGELLSAPV
jgi:cysteate synthase